MLKERLPSVIGGGNVRFSAPLLDFGQAGGGGGDDLRRVLVRQNIRLDLLRKVGQLLPLGLLP